MTPSPPPQSKLLPEFVVEGLAQGTKVQPGGGALRTAREISRSSPGETSPGETSPGETSQKPLLEKPLLAKVVLAPLKNTQTALSWVEIPQGKRSWSDRS